VPGQLSSWRRHAGQATEREATVEHQRIVTRCLEAVLRDPRTGIPAEWKRIEGWDEKILTVCRSTYRAQLNLYRWVARRSPVKFLQNAWAALSLDPQWLFAQCGRGFAGGDELHVEPLAALADLVSLFQAPWPPRRI
jgi:hypothetical protein